MLADRSGTLHTPTIVMPHHGTRIGTVNPMPFSSILTNSQPKSTLNSYLHSSYQINPTWLPLFTSIPFTLYPGKQKKPERYHSVLEETTPSIPSTSGQQYDDYEATMELWHCMAADQMLRGEMVLMLFRLHHLKNSPPLIGETQEDIHKEPRPHIFEAMPEDHVLAEVFDNQLDQVLLLINFIQMRTRILKLVNKLEVLTEKLTNIAFGLDWNSMPGMH